MNKFLAKTKAFLDQHSSTILTCIGAAGVIATAVMSATATPKALDAIEQAKKEKGEKLTANETIKAAAPAYIPAALMGVSTIACMFGANALNKKHQASLASAYMILDNSYKEYKRKTQELYGEDGHKRIIGGIAEDMYADESDIPERKEGKKLFFDFYSLQFFQSTMDEVIQAERYVNHVMNTRGYVGLSEFYDELGISCRYCDREEGWSKGAGRCLYGYDEIEFVHQTARSESGEEYYIIVMNTEPTADFLNF